MYRIWLMTELQPNYILDLFGKFIYQEILLSELYQQDNCLVPTLSLDDLTTRPWEIRLNDKHCRV